MAVTGRKAKLEQRYGRGVPGGGDSRAKVREQGATSKTMRYGPLE